MIPHTLVLEPGLRTYKVYMGYWFWGRHSVTELWHGLRDVTRRVRADWDISTPELRTAWARGDKASFSKRRNRKRSHAPPHTRLQRSIRMDCVQ